MKKTSKTKRSVSAESIARLADNGQDVSSYFTNKGKMIRPLKNQDTDLTKGDVDQFQKCTRALMERVHRRDLVYEFFFVFSRFEHALSVTNYLTEGKGGVSADWNKFAREMNDVFLASLSSEVKKAVRYYEVAPPRKQVVDFDSLIWKDVVPQTDYQLEKLLLLVRRVRNNLFHGEKFSVLLEGDSKRDMHLLGHGLTILYACLQSSHEIRKKFFSEIEWEIEDDEREDEIAVS
ncbi:MAG TPA: hypothetical protein VKC61_15235 [Pyrinomonadaceae bacterium]|nr:hypothetical protein [Pyrinomonadaceae bacterium]